jgi:hypothetical protein
LLAVPLLAAVVSLGGCSLSREKETPAKRTVLDLVAWPEKDIWPEALLSMPQPTIDNYKAVVPRKDLLQYMPCYCGCYANGHLSVYDCYVAEERDDGSIVLDTMSFG